ncbi:MAG: pilus assembly protein [Shimia sp.]|uniref:TadE/TadG family type IV pilus assembly protein n=1 Tax=Shimia sp. TaxID=1954381 RepID=UPI001B03A4EB|nr:TadE/TadG family type IV pilus assembly protein [Shimia sp.]MBO6897357.1 pilus assembly protein [Shimia sp.]
MLNSKLLSGVRSFRKDHSGTVAVETVIIFPALLFVLFAMMNIFDAYRAKSTTEKAAFAVSDMLSRETTSVNCDYLNGIHAVLEEMSTVRSSHSMTITHVYWSVNTNDYELYWTRNQSCGAGVTAGEFEAMKGKLPQLVDGESLLVVETSATYAPPILAGWDGKRKEGSLELSETESPLNMDIDTFVFSRPRFAPQLAWSNS